MGDQDQHGGALPGAARGTHMSLISSVLSPAGMSEDSDYTSDVNYPVGQHANSSASQFLSVANQLATPQRSLETSRENSYEKDDGQYSDAREPYSYDGSYEYDDSYTQEHNRKNEDYNQSGGG